MHKMAIELRGHNYPVCVSNHIVGFTITHVMAALVQTLCFTPQTYLWLPWLSKYRLNHKLGIVTRLPRL